MPTRKDVTYTYTCDICHAPFSSPKHLVAYREAQICELQGTPKTHAFKNGVITANLHNYAGWDRRTFEIMGRSFEKRTHRPMYTIRIIEGPYCRVGEVYDTYGEDIVVPHIHRTSQPGCVPVARILH